MPKKAKKSMFDSVMSQNNAEASVQNAEASVQNADADLNNANNLNTDNSEKFEIKKDIKYDDVCDKSDELVRLSKENSNLTDKLASYINELSSLKADYNKLKEECDSYLIKISTLSFENATLKAQLDKLSQTKNIDSAKFNSQINVNQSKNVPYMHTIKCNNNGYSDWN